jgi:hypothetical protein
VTAHRHLMKVFVSLDLPYDRYLPQWRGGMFIVEHKSHSLPIGSGL